MLQLKLNSEKILPTLLYIIKQLNEAKVDFHKVFKLLYFAEQKHLVEYGSVIIGGWYSAMKNGPVPSEIYDDLKTMRNEGQTNIAYNEFLKIEESYFLVALNMSIDFDVLSKSEMKCIKASVEENKSLNYEQLTEKSHDSAWTLARKSTSLQSPMSVIEIAKAGGADEEMIEYIQLVIENERVLA